MEIIPTNGNDNTPSYGEYPKIPTWRLFANIAGVTIISAYLASTFIISGDCAYVKAGITNLVSDLVNEFLGIDCQRVN